MFTRIIILLMMCALMPQGILADAIDGNKKLYYSVERQIGMKDGLSNNFVLCLAIDGHGYVWVGTESGLNRIAGNMCNAYWREQIGNDNDKILSLCYDKHTDRMLVGTENGLRYFSYKTGRFSNETVGDSLIDYSVASIVDDGRQGMWLIYGNGEIQHLDCMTNKVVTLKQTERSGCRCGLYDGNGNLFLGHGKDGMSILTLKSPDDYEVAEVKRFLHNSNDSSIPGNNVRCIYQDKSGRIWVGTDRGAALYDAETETFRKVVRKSYSNTNANISDNVYDIKEMADGRIWVATDMGGIDIVDLSDIANRIVFDDSEVELSSINTRCILQDGYRNIWIGNHSTGVDFLPNKKPFIHTLDYYDRNNRLKRTYAVASDDEGRLWLGSVDELSLWQGQANSQKMLGEWRIDAMRSRSHSFPRCMLADSKGYVWMGMEDEGVVRFNTHTHRFESIDLGHEVPDIHSFYEDNDGRVWIGSQFGVCIYDKGSVSHEHEIDRLLERAPVSGFLRVSADEMFIATQGRGAVLLNQKTMKTKMLNVATGLPSNNINHIMTDRSRGLWMATNEGLVYIKDVYDLEKIKIYDTRNSLGDNHVSAILQDLRGRIWISTYKGIACLDPETEQFYNYSQHDNVHISGFQDASSAMTSGGLMYFGSPNGVCYFNPDETRHSQQVSQVKITLCEVYNPSSSKDLMTSHPYNLITSQPQTLPYHQNTLRLAFAVDDYAQAENVEYSYMMKGLSDKWYYTGNDHDVMFRSLNPGNYTFTLRAKLKSQDWDEASTAQMEISIAPPYWKSAWAYAFYILVVVGVVLLIFKQYKRKLKLQNSLQLERIESGQRQQLNEERLRFFTNITHELRTPLTLILGPLEDLVNDERLPYAYRKKVTTINNSAQRLKNLINDILDFRKTETQNRHLVVAKDDIGKLISGIALNYKELLRNDKVEVRLDVAQKIPHIYFDSEVVTTIMNNLLSNAVKYTPSGLIEVAVRVDGDSVSISVRDTGCGIEKSALPHIFDRYYQAESAQHASGTGIGLALVKSLAQLHQAELSVDSQIGVGSVFTVSFLIDNKYPDALHKDDEPVEVPFTEETTDKAEETDGRPTILVVEDNEDIRQYIAESLGDEYNILMAENGEDGYQKASDSMPDIIVSDIMMPIMNGIDMVKRLKENINTSHILVILLTAKDSTADREEGYDCGADSYMTKPFSAKLLNSRIRNLLSARRRMAEKLSEKFAHGDLSGSVHGEKEQATVQITLNAMDRDFIQRLDRVIEENIMREDLDMPFMTDKMNMSHTTLYRKIKALTGLTAKEYIRKRRLQKCYQLLESGGYNVNEAAYMTGFNQMGHFREVFKKEFGITPSTVMKKQRT